MECYSLVVCGFFYLLCLSEIASGIPFKKSSKSADYNEVASSKQVFKTKSSLLNPFSYKDKLMIATSPYESKFSIKRGRLKKTKQAETLVTDGNNVKKFSHLTTKDQDSVLEDALKTGRIYICYPAENISIKKEKNVSAEIVLLKAVVKDMLSGLVENFFNKYGRLFIRI